MKRQAGSTLLEVLVALTLFSGTALGLVRLQWQGMSDHHLAYRRFQANLLAEDLAERLQAGPEASQASLHLFPFSGGRCMEPLTTEPAASLQPWLNQLDCQLPGARASLQRHGNYLEIHIDDDGWQLLRRLSP